MSRCRSCDAEIVWATTAVGKAMPLDAIPNDAGNVEVTTDAQSGLLRVIAVHKEPPMFGEAPVYMPHHGTCPNANEWRKR